MKWFLLTLLLLTQVALGQQSCTTSTGNLTVNCTLTRTSGQSPLFVMGDCTGSTYSGTLKGGNTVTQDVWFAWNFGDGGASGTQTWQYGSNPGKNLKNVASGIVAAHLYVTQGADTNYVPSIWVYDGIDALGLCSFGVTVFDPGGPNGFTVQCYYSSTPAPAGQCPGNGSQALSVTAHAPSSGQAIFYKCGDLFSGNVVETSNVNGFSIGAYGGCQNTPITSTTQSQYPQMSGNITVNIAATDGRISDLVMNTGGTTAILLETTWDPPYTALTQMTLYNIWSNATNGSFYCARCSQTGFIQVVQNKMGSIQGTFLNHAQNKCVGGSVTYCPTAGWAPVTYNAILGSHFDGTGATGTGDSETVRVSACRMCAFTNSDYGNAHNGGAPFKFHSGNAGAGNNTSCIWLGQWSEYIEISDNYYYGNSGAELVEVIAQNPVTDERLRYIVFERNILAPTTSGHQLLAGAINMTVRNNIFHASGTAMGQRGFQGSSNNTAGSICSGTGTTTAPVINPYATGDEFYNNVCYQGQCGPFAANGVSPAATNSFAKNILTYQSAAIAGGSGNSVGNNSPNTTANPAFTNGSGTFRLMTDFLPTANFTGADSTVPNYFDGCFNTGYSWQVGQSYGALTQVCKVQPPSSGITLDSSVATLDSTTITLDGK